MAYVAIAASIVASFLTGLFAGTALALRFIVVESGVEQEDDEVIDCEICGHQAYGELVVSVGQDRHCIFLCAGCKADRDMIVNATDS